MSTESKRHSPANKQSSGNRAGDVVGAVTIFIGIAGFFGLIWFGLGH